MPFTPTSFLQPTARAAGQAARPARPKNPQQDVDSLLETLGRGTLSGVATVGNVLDLPFSSIRDVLSGENPLDQWASPTRFKDRITEREMFSRLGLMRPNKPTGISGWADDPGEGVRDVGAFLMGLPLDPLSYLTLGGSALTRSGQAARAAGLLGEAKRLVPKGVGKRMARQQLTLGDLVRGASQGDAASRARAAAEGAGLDFDELMRSGEPLGRAFGLGIPFKDPAATFNLGRVGRGSNRALDWMGGKLTGPGPVGAPGRYLRGLFDSSAGGRFDPIQQEIEEFAHGGGREGQAAARLAEIEQLEPIDEAYTAFDREFRGQVRPTRSDLDPRDIDRAIDEVVGQRMAEWHATAPERQFRRENLPYVTMARRGRDPASMPRFNELAEDYRRLTGNPSATEQDVMDALLRRDPRPTRAAPGVVREAEEAVGRQQLAGATPAHPFSEGDVVLAADRGNYGYVRRVGPRTSEVFFHNKQTGASATKILPNDQLTRAFDAGSEQADEFSRLMTYKVFDDILRLTGETDLETAFAEMAPGLQPSEELSGRIRALSENMRAAEDTAYESFLSKGGRGAWLDRHDLDAPLAGAKHVPRFVDPQVAKEHGAVLRRLPVSFGGARARTSEIKRVPAAIVNRLLREKRRYRGEASAENILADFGEYLDPQYGIERQAGLEFAPPSRADALRRHAEDLADWVKGHRKQDLFTRSRLQDFSRYMQGVHMAGRSMEAIHEVFRRNAGNVEEGFDLHSAFRQASMDPDAALEHFARKFGMPVEQARQLKVPQDVVNAAKGVIKPVEEPEWLRAIGEAVDGFNRMFKTAVTVPFPGFMARNFGSGQVNNLVSGHVQNLRDLGQYKEQFRQAYRLSRDAVRDPSNLTAQQKQWLREINAYRIAGRRIGFQDVELSSGGGGSGLARPVPGSPFRLREVAQEARQRVAQEPMGVDAIPGLMSSRRGYRTLVEAGTRANQHVEWYNRVPMYMYLREKGWSPSAAARKVDELQVDYSDLAPFERTVMRRLVPFYSFTRKITPHIVRTLLQRPGGALGQTIRGTSRSTGADRAQPVPQYVAETLAAPLGKLDDGTRRFLTGLGLAHEVPLAFAGGGLRRAGMEGLSMMNPLVKAPLEWATGESFFQRGPMGGRELSDMDPAVGRLMTNIGLQREAPSGRAAPVLGSPLLEHAAVNTPASRFITTARQVTDPRKYQGGPFMTAMNPINLLTGLNVYDVSPASQEAILRDRTAAMALDELGGRLFEKAYIPKEAIARSAAEQPRRAERMRAFNAIQSLLANRARRRAEQAERQAE